MKWILAEPMCKGMRRADRFVDKGRLLQCHSGTLEPSDEMFLQRIQEVQTLARELTSGAEARSKSPISYADAMALAEKHFPEAHTEYELACGAATSRDMRHALSRRLHDPDAPTLKAELQTLLGLDQEKP